MPIKEIARYLRKRQTPAERMLWDKIRNRKPARKKFLRQHPIILSINGEQRFFITDFFCAELRLIVEIDGKIHERQKAYDVLREWIIGTLGYRIIRFTNEEIETDIESVLKMIQIPCQEISS